MYCTSTDFLARMRTYTDEIEKRSDGSLSFVEYIPLPHFGHTILRFDLTREDYTLADLDAYEALMQDIVQDAFLVDFMGSVYQKVGFEPWMYEEKFRKCYSAYQDISVTPGDDQMELKKDAGLLLESCGLPQSTKIWEIQIEEDIFLFVLGRESRKIGTYLSGNDRIHVYETEEIPCTGLMRAIMYAKTQHISMVRVLLEA